MFLWLIPTFVDGEIAVEADTIPQGEANNKSPGLVEEDPHDVVYSNLPEEVHVLKDVPGYPKCGAEWFQFESKGFCCRDDKVAIANSDTPPEMMKLWQGSKATERHFRDHIRFFNGT